MWPLSFDVIIIKNKKKSEKNNSYSPFSIIKNLKCSGNLRYHNNFILPQYTANHKSLLSESLKTWNKIPYELKDPENLKLTIKNIFNYLN